VRFDKSGYQLTLFPCQSSSDLSTKWVCVKRHIIFLKICMSFKILELTDWWENMQQKDGRRPLWMISETFETTTAAASECGLVWRTADSCQWGDWRMETSLGLCPCKGTPFWTFVVVMDAECFLLGLSFSRWIGYTVYDRCFLLQYIMDPVS